MKMELSKIKEEISLIQDYLNITCSDNPEEIQERIRVIMPYISRTGFLLAEAKKTLRRKKASEISNTIIHIAKEQCLSAKVQNTLIDSIAEDESYLVDLIDRINAACTHQVDGLRSLLSYSKEELRIIKTGY